MKYVLDTNVVSALRVRGRNPEVERWIAEIPVVDQYVTAMSMAVIERGVLAKERADPAQGEVLRRWFTSRLLPAFAGRVRSFDLEAARVLATYRVPEYASLDDALIAAVADSSGMVVVTRSIKNFAPLGVRCVDPWAVGP